MRESATNPILDQSVVLEDGEDSVFDALLRALLLLGLAMSLAVALAGSLLGWYYKNIHQNLPSWASQLLLPVGLIGLGLVATGIGGGVGAAILGGTALAALILGLSAQSGWLGSTLKAIGGGAVANTTEQLGVDDLEELSLADWGELIQREGLAELETNQDEYLADQFGGLLTGVTGAAGDRVAAAERAAAQAAGRTKEFFAANPSLAQHGKDMEKVTSFLVGASPSVAETITGAPE